MTQASDKLLATTTSILAQCLVSAAAAEDALAQARAVVLQQPINVVPIPIWGNFPLASFPSGYTLSSVLGANDLYQVPPGRKALVIDILVTNSTGNSVIYYPQFKIGSDYYGLGEPKTATAGIIGTTYGTTDILSFSPIILNAGEVFSIQTSGFAGCSFWLLVIEFDARCPIHRAQVIDFVAGDNVVYTVPLDKTFYCGMSVGLSPDAIPSIVFSGFHYFNSGINVRTVGGVYLVPSGGAPSTANIINAGGPQSNQTGFMTALLAGLNPDDSIVINSDAAGGSQLAWFNYVEVNTNGTFG